MGSLQKSMSAWPVNLRKKFQASVGREVQIKQQWVATSHPSEQQPVSDNTYSWWEEVERIPSFKFLVKMAIVTDFQKAILKYLLK